MRTRSRLLISTSLLAIALAAAPITIHFDLGEIGPSAAHAAECCFSGQTPILMADGTTQPIGKIRIGDKVLSRSGRINRVIGLEVVPLAGRRLYAINDLEPFFTAEHPFLSPGGWKAVDTAAAAREAGSLRITALCTGDLLVTARHGVAESQGATALAPGLILGTEKIVTLRAVPRRTDLPVFNLMLDGDHSYVANGFAVHNKGGEGGGGESGESGDDDDDDDDDDDGGESGGGGSGGEGESGSGSEESGSGESGSGESGSGESGSGGEGGSDRDEVFSGSADRAGPDLTPEEERALILLRWKR